MTNHNQFGKSSWAQIVDRSVKIINFYDMGGSDKTLKASSKALSADYLDYVFLVIAVNKGITTTTNDFLKIALSLDLPIVTVFTKVDMVNEEDLFEFFKNFKSILKCEKKGKNPLLAKNKDDIVTFSRNINEGIMPIFVISNKTGYGLDLFINFLNLLPVNTKDDLSKLGKYNSNLIMSAENQFDILETMTIDNKIPILAGIVSRGSIYKGGQYKLGPDSNGNFKLVEVLSIHCKKIEVKSAANGQFCSIQLDNSISKDCVRSGMVLLPSNISPSSAKIFEAEIWSIDGKEKKLKFTAQPIVHISHIRQCVKLKKYEEIFQSEELKTFDLSLEEISIYPDKTTKVYFEFMYSPEFIREGSHLIIYENNIKIYGFITKIIK